jgi:naphthoate synthase
MSWTSWQTVQGDGLDFAEIAYEKKFHDELEGGVARVSFNRPDKMNAMTTKTVDEMFRAFYDANHDPMIGAIIVAGRGDNFGAGGDVDWEQWGLREAFYFRYPHNRLLRTSRKPVIAAVQGYCIGGHNHMAYCCDFTIAADNAVFGQAGPRVSSPADGAFVPYLVSVVGAKRAREMWMLCRRYSAQQALEMGLVNAVVPLDRLEAEVDAWCEELLAVSPGCLEVLKAAFDQELDQFAEMGVISGAMYPDWFDSPEGKEGGAAFLEKRKPRFWAIRKQQSEGR